MTRMAVVCDLQLLLLLDVVANNKNVAEILVRDRIVAEILVQPPKRDSPIFVDAKIGTVPQT